MSVKQQRAINGFMHILREWDKGLVPLRKRILVDFIRTHQNKTGTEIEEELAHSASLFLTRITAWIRLTYFLIYISQKIVKKIYSIKLYDWIMLKRTTSNITHILIAK